MAENSRSLAWLPHRIFVMLTGEMANDILRISVDGVRSLVRTSGIESGSEAVVFVHGNPGSSEDWGALLPRAGTFARALAPDMPGYGRADRPKQFDYTVAGYARHLAGLLDQLGVRRAHLVLHDFGVPWGLRWATDHPTAAASVTLINCGVMPGYRWHKYARIWRTPIAGELMALTTTRAIFRTLLDRENPKPFPRAFADRMFDDLDWGTKRAILRLYRATSEAEVRGDHIASLLASLRLPALVIWGAEDLAIPASHAEVQQRFFSPADIHVLPGCGHWPFIDEPESVAARLLPFLCRQLGAAA